MVGVAGKSQACHTCKRRRVKCDLRRPTCIRCEKANATCAGYERDSIFINSTPTQPSLTAAFVISEAKREESKNSRRPIYEEDMRSLVSQATNPSSYIPVEFRGNAVKLSKKIYLPQPLQTTDLNEFGSVHAWLGCISVLSQESRALDLSLLAFCVFQTQLTKTSSFSLEEGHQFYNEALQHHRTDLQDEQKRSRDEYIATIIVLTTCELFIFPIDHPWRVHSLGISEILRLRGQFVPQTRIWNSLYSRLRIVCILDGLTKQKPLVLLADDWPDASKCIYSQPIDRLLDIAIDIPASLAQSNALMDDPHPEQQDYELARIVKEFIDVINKIYSWQQHRTNLRPYSAVLSQIHNPADDKYPTKLFPFTLEFESLDSAILFSFTWAIYLQVFNKLIHIHQWFHSRAAYLPALRELFGHDVQQDLQTTFFSDLCYMNPDKVSISFINTEADRLSRLLCQCIGYCYRADMGTIGPQSCRYLQWVMRQFFRQNAGYERELEWVLQIKYVTGPGLHEQLGLMEFDDNP